MSPTTCTSSPLLVIVIMPATLLPDFGSNLQVAFVTSCPCAANIRAQIIPKEMINVFIDRKSMAGLNDLKPIYRLDAFCSLEPARPRAGEDDMRSQRPEGRPSPTGFNQSINRCS